MGTSLVVQGLKFHTAKVGGKGLLPGWGTKIPHAVSAWPKDSIICLFIFDCAGSSLLRWLFLSFSKQGLLSSRSALASHCGGFSCCGARALERALCSRGSVVAEHGFSSCSSWALEHRLSSCGPRALLLSGIWDLSRSRTEPVSPALAGRFFTTEPPGKPPND